MLYKTCPHCGAQGSIHYFPTGKASHCLACGATSGFLWSWLLGTWRHPAVLSVLSLAVLGSMYGLGYRVGFIEGDSRRPVALPDFDLPAVKVRQVPLPEHRLAELPATWTHISRLFGEKLLAGATLQDWKTMKPEAQLALCRIWAREAFPSQDEDWVAERARVYFRRIEQERFLAGFVREIDGQPLPAPRILRDDDRLEQFVAAIDGSQ